MAPLLARIDETVSELEQLLAQAKDAPLSEEAYQRLLAAIHTLGQVAHLLEDKEATLGRLRQLLFGATTEKTRHVLAQAGVEPQSLRPGPTAGPPEERAAPGHGRTAADAYVGARTVRLPHPTLRPGDRCPECRRGRVYVQAEPGALVRVIGQPPLGATVYASERLRCNLCGEIFTAALPADVGAEKYDATAVAMIVLLKYGSGVPFHRLAELQHAVGIPLPAATQWELVAAVAATLQPVLDELIRQAAQGAVLYNDDTQMCVLALRQTADDTGAAAARTGVFTSGIVATCNNQRIALFFTGRKHAGENLAAVLSRRAAELGPPIQMCDALPRNLPKPLAVILGNCLAHGRGQFVEVASNFPEECRHVLEVFAAVYRHDEQTREQALAPEDRLRFHQTHSGPVMTELHARLTAHLAEKRVEPNSGLGRAITYLLNHWEPLTLFLRQPGAPLDNNICERALKKAILHRKNALFYKTQNGAQVGDLFMTLIHTCELCGANPFDYLTELQRHAAELATNPGEWLPWNYRETLARAGSEHGPAP
jgi:hypothetical protein